MYLMGVIYGENFEIASALGLNCRSVLGNWFGCKGNERIILNYFRIRPVTFFIF